MAPRRCLHFRNREYYNASCRVEANGRQTLLWQDPAGPTGQGLPGRWESKFEFLPNAPLCVECLLKAMKSGSPLAALA